MKPDAGIAPVRRAREAISHEVGNDPARLVEYYVALQQRFASQVVQAPREGAPEPANEDERSGRSRGDR